MLQINRIQSILGNKNIINCECGFKYLPMNEITEFLCPSCQVDLIEALDYNEEEIDVEEVSMENELIEDYLSDVAFEFNDRKVKK